MPKRGREETARLKALVECFVLEYGGRVNEDQVESTWILPTRLGILLVSVHDSEVSASLGFLAVFGRFTEPERARSLGCNPHSGKWNHHEGNVAEGATAEKTFEAWRSMISGALPVESETATEASVHGSASERTP
jgi:hypothetical protein